MEKLYMLEVIVNKIIFDNLPVPLKQDIVVYCNCPNIGSLEIRTDVMGALENLETRERSSKRKDVDINCGRSVLFPIDAKKLKDVLGKEQLEVSVRTRIDETPIGTLLLPWHRDFIDMVNSSIDTIGYLTPVCKEDEFDMIRDGVHSATITMFLKLSYQGRTIYTNIQKIISKESSGAPGEAPASFLFKSVGNATIFKCQRHDMGDDNDIIPVGAIYSMTSKFAPVSDKKQKFPRTSEKLQSSKSTETLLSFRPTIGSTTSIAPSVFFGMGEYDRTAMMQNVLSNTESKSSMAMPIPAKGAKFLNLTDLHMDVSTFSMLASALGMHVYQGSGKSIEREGEGEDSEGFFPLFVDYKSLTVKEIEQRLCKHPDCPAAKLFKNYGIGPLAKNITGLGGLYNDVEAPCAYGLSHCNGNIDNYGPLGRFKRPIKTDLPFVPQSNCKCGTKSSTISTSSKASNTKSNTKGKSECYRHCPMNPMKRKQRSNHDNVMRLKGGGQFEIPCDPPPNPVTMCQDLMDEFNKVLKNYKDALGPCGQATCPFAINFIGDACQDICNSSDPEYRRKLCELSGPEAELNEKDEFTGCGVPNCPYKRAAITPADKEYSKYQGMPGCGYTKCPFVKAKLGMEPDEDNHLPAFKDYQKQETYKFSDALPPIHWDCPDPLPDGDCKNPDCPFVKRDALIKKYFPEPTCPCGSPVCPYVCSPCTFPGCPFHVAEPCPPVCPYTEPPPKTLKCTASVCPFVRNTETCCKNPACPYKQYEDKLAECVQWEREQALLAEQEAEEEEQAPCAPCGRSKSKKDRCKAAAKEGNKSKSTVGLSSSMVPTSKTNAISTSGVNINKTSEPCILSAALDKRPPSCKPGTCGVGEQVCKVCKADPKESKDIRSERSDLKTKSDQCEETVTKSKEDFEPSKSITFTTQLKSESKQTTEKSKNGILKKDQSGADIEAVNKKEVKAKKKGKNPLLSPKDTKAFGKPYANKSSSTPCKLSQLCRKIPFRFDRKSYKPCKMIGHRECVLPKFLVPKCMGWLWNIHEDVCGLRPRRGWKPGAVSKMIAFRMDYFNAMREKRPFGHHADTADALTSKPSQPTILVNKKGGVVNVTMHPIKAPAEVKKAGDGNPYMDCTPIQFKITKNQPEKEKKFCYCGDQLSDTEDSSELDIEFSPPGAMRNPRLVNKFEMKDAEAQYRIDDVPLPEKKEKKGKNKGGKSKQSGKGGKKKT